MRLSKAGLCKIVAHDCDDMKRYTNNQLNININKLFLIKNSLCSVHTSLHDPFKVSRDVMYSVSDASKHLYRVT